MARQAYSHHERQQDALRKRACRRMGAGPSERSPQGIRMGKGRGREPEPNPFICAPFKSRYGAILEPEIEGFGDLAQIKGPVPSRQRLQEPGLVGLGRSTVYRELALLTGATPPPS